MSALFWNRIHHVPFCTFFLLLSRTEAGLASFACWRASSIQAAYLTLKNAHSILLQCVFGVLFRSIFEDAIFLYAFLYLHLNDNFWMCIILPDAIQNIAIFMYPNKDIWFINVMLSCFFLILEERIWKIAHYIACWRKQWSLLRNLEHLSQEWASFFYFRVSRSSPFILQERRC